MAVSLDDKLLGEKAHYYCSSSEDEDDREDGDDHDDDEEGGAVSKLSKAAAPEAEPPSLGPYSGTCTNVKEIILLSLSFIYLATNQ